MTWWACERYANNASDWLALVGKSAINQTHVARLGKL